jgi:hypothetical protein
MTTLNNQAELFVELNDEQAEIVSGGISYTQITGTDYFKSFDAVMSASNTQSGPGGSSVTQVNGAVSERVRTGAGQFLQILT